MRKAILLLLLILGGVFSTINIVHAQVEIIEQRLGPYVYDSTFVIGAHGVPMPDWAIDSLKMEFTQLYAQDVEAMHARLNRIHLGITHDTTLADTGVWLGANIYEKFIHYNDYHSGGTLPPDI